MYKAIIFDLDGTLLNTIDDIADSANAALRRFGYPEFPVDKYKYFVGRGVDELIDKLIAQNGINPDEFNQLKQAYIEEYAIRNSHKTHAYEGIIKLLKGLKNLGIAICILSNKPHFQTVEVVEKYFSDISFNHIFGKKPEFPIKPNPASAFELIKLLKLDRSEVLYVGDTDTDIQTAKNADLKSVGVLWGFRKELELKEAGADYIVNSPERILAIIKGDF